MGFTLFVSIILFLHAPGIMGAFLLKGMYAPVFTPFDDNGMVDTSVLDDYAQYISERGVRGVFIADSAGEGPNLREYEKKLLFRTWVPIARKYNLDVVAQIGGDSQGEMISLAKYCECLEVDVIAVLPTLYFKPKTVEELTQLLEAVAEAAPSIGIHYHHYINYTNVDLNMAEFFALATERIPNFIGISCNLWTAVQISAVNTLKHPQSLCIRDHTLITAAAFLGYRCFATAAINVYPELVAQAIVYGIKGNSSLATKTQLALTRIAEGISNEGTLISGHKAAMEVYAGINVGDARLPLQPLSDEAKMNVKDITDTIDELVDDGYELTDEDWEEI